LVLLALTEHKEDKVLLVLKVLQEKPEVKVLKEPQAP
jgi:hypothetical protein